MDESPERGSDGPATPAPMRRTQRQAVADARPHRVEGPPHAEASRLLLVLCSLAFALAVALLKPLPSRADSGDPVPTPDPAPTNTDPVVPPLPVVHAAPVRRPAALLHRALRVPLGDKVVKYAKHLLGVRYVCGGSSPASGFDCSGLVRYVYGHFGVRLAHSSFAQFTSGLHVSRARPQARRPGLLRRPRARRHLRRRRPVHPRAPLGLARPDRAARRLVQQPLRRRAPPRRRAARISPRGSSGASRPWP